jgi:broad specificity phosphatase PhoE
MASRLWKEELRHQIPFPEKMYCSPLSRALHTNVITFEDEAEPERLILEVKCLCIHLGWLGTLTMRAY